MSTSRTVNLVGGRGYTGSELLRLVAGHPHMNLGIASSRSHAGQAISSTCGGWPDDGRAFTQLEPEGISAHPADAWVLALPNGLAARWVERIRTSFPDSVILDRCAAWFNLAAAVVDRAAPGCARINLGDRGRINLGDRGRINLGDRVNLGQGNDA